jgi:hypothetical protein
MALSVSIALKSDPSWDEIRARRWPTWESSMSARGKHINMAAPVLQIFSQLKRITSALLPPPRAPERTLQASGQGQSIARLSGGLPCCSVPASTTRWAVKRRHAAAEETKKKEKR